MSLWKVTEGRAQILEETSFADENIVESKLESWICEHPKMLGEELLIIGRQVPVQGLGDKIDVLALDGTGALVIIEVKRGDIKAPVDIQAIRYASYASKWNTDILEKIAGDYVDDGNELTLEERFQSFAELEEGDEDSALNHKQRMIIVGQRVRDRLGSVALWLRDQGVDIKLVEIRPFRNGAELFLDPTVIIPPPSTEEWEAVGATVGNTAKPWLAAGEEWHRTRAGAISFQRTQSLIEKLQRCQLADTVSYAQKHYVAVRRAGTTWLRVRPRPSVIMLDVRCDPDEFEIEALAKKLGLMVFSAEDELKDKLALPSSVGIYHRRAYYCVRLRLKNEYDVLAEPLYAFLDEAAEKWT